METVIRIVAEFWSVLCRMSPYLLFGFAMAGLLSVLIPAGQVARHLGGGGFWPVIKAALFGIPLPLCSCSVIPVAASLRKSGAGRGATTAFLLATPMTGVDSILAVYSLLGPVFAAFTPLAALVSGCLGGFGMNLLSRDEPGRPEPAPPRPSACGCGPRVAPAPSPSPDPSPCGCGETPAAAAAPPDQPACACGDDAARSQVRPEPSPCGCAAAEAAPTSQPEPGWRQRAWRHGFVTLPRDIARDLLIGLVAAGVITALVPPDFFSRDFGGGLAAKLVVMLVGIPLYVCASASIPVAAALMGKGLSAGGALVFLMTGPATNAATLMTIRHLLGRRSVWIFLAAVVTAALVMGTALDLLVTVAAAAPMREAAEMHGGWFGHVSAVLLLGVLATACWSRRRG